MKKCIGILLAVMICVAAFAAAEETTRPEGGKRFEGDWATGESLLQITGEDDGYRVCVTLEKAGEAGGTIWQYSCFYHEDTDSLVSVSSSKTAYTYDPEYGDRIFEDSAYEGFDDAEAFTEFTIGADGKLAWKDGRENAGEGILFTNIGTFDGLWTNEAEETAVEFMWNGPDPEHFDYTVYIFRGTAGEENYASYLMTGTYDPETGKLTAYGTCSLFKTNADGEYVSEDDGETYEAIFSKTEDGKVLYETDNGIELEYDQMGHSQG